MIILKDINSLELNNIINDIENERKLIEEIKKGNKEVEKKISFENILFIVESPNKARTISSFFGRPSIRKINNLQVYEFSIGKKQVLITASKGHVIDLTTKEIGLHGIDIKDGKFIPYYNTIKKCRNCGAQFTEYAEGNKCPYCGSTNIDDSIERIKALQELAQEVDYIIIGTDPDTEGEFIAYSLYILLKPFNKKIYRAEFHEVTKTAILNALENLREIDLNLVKSQLVRRIEDRWLGFSLSQIVQKFYDKKWLSAGRVQTPVLGWIVDRYLERLKSTSYILYLNPNNENLVIDTDIKDRKEINKLKKNLIGKYVKIKDYKEYEEILNPLPPYTTSTMLQEASVYLKIDVNKIMQIAQQLFEQGLITYHRTDSTRISNVGIQIAKDYISQKFGENYFKGRSWGEGGAHEGIRPTRPWDSDQLREAIENGDIEIFIDMTKYHYGLYDLIFKRFMQSQMKEVKVKMFKQILNIELLNKDIEISGLLDVIDHGWDLIYSYRIEVLKAKPLNEFKIEEIKSKKVPKVRLYREADIIDLMKQRDIGRPSTYATIIEKILNRGYVINKGNALLPTKFGIEIYSFLNKNYHKFVSEERTRQLEDIMDYISEGKQDYIEVLKSLYEETIEIEKTKENIEK